MVPQQITAWTLARIIAALFTGLVSAPAQLAPAVINRRRA
jgi:hypothetical protein